MDSILNTREKRRCWDGCYLVEGDNGKWICDNVGKDIHDIPDSECAAENSDVWADDDVFSDGRDFRTGPTVSCKVLSADEFRLLLEEIYADEGLTVYLDFSADGLYIGLGEDDLPAEDLHERIAEALGVSEVTSIHIDDCEPTGVWIAFRENPSHGDRPCIVISHTFDPDTTVFAYSSEEEARDALERLYSVYLKEEIDNNSFLCEEKCWCSREEGYACITWDDDSHTSFSITSILDEK